MTLLVGAAVAWWHMRKARNQLLGVRMTASLIAVAAVLFSMMFGMAVVRLYGDPLTLVVTFAASFVTYVLVSPRD